MKKSSKGKWLLKIFFLLTSFVKDEDGGTYLTVPEANLSQAKTKFRKDFGSALK